MKPKPILSAKNTENMRNHSWPTRTLRKFHHSRPPLLTLSNFNVPNEEAEENIKEDVFYCDYSQIIKGDSHAHTRTRLGQFPKEDAVQLNTNYKPNWLILLSSSITRKRGDFIEEGFFDTKRYVNKSIPSKPKFSRKPIGIESLDFKEPVPPDATNFISTRRGDLTEESFIDANIYFDKTMVPIPKLSVEQSKKENEKTSKKIVQRKTPLRALINVYADYLYDDDYIQSNYYYLLEIEKRYVLRKSYLEKRCNVLDRQMTVNWIVQITEKLYLEESTMFSAVRMFDAFLVSSQKVKREHYFLTALTCLWISSKLVDRNTHTVKLYNACSRRYNKAQFVAAEKKILCLLKLDVNYPEPLVILNYYLRRQCLQNNNNARYAAVFLLECFMLLSEFSSSSPSMLAAAALFLTYLKLEMLVQASLFLNFIEDHLLSRALFKKYSLALYKLVLDNIFCCRTISWNSIAKYSTQDKLKVAEMFISIS